MAVPEIQTIINPAWLNNPTPPLGSTPMWIKFNPKPTPQQTSSIRSAVTDLVGMRGELVKNKGIVEAQDAAVKGAKAEIEAYTAAGGIATENARLVEEAGKIQQLQQERALNMSLGTTRAELAGAGLSASGSALDILKSSVRQGYLQQQITATQTALTSNAYLEQSVASKAQVAGATAQLEAAQAYGKTAGEVVKTTETNIDAETKALLGVFQENQANPNFAGSPEIQLAMAQLKDNGGTGRDNINQIFSRSSSSGWRRA